MFDVELNKSITQYDSESKKIGFQKFTSDEWINTINNVANKVRKNEININKTANNNIENNLETLYNNNERKSDVNKGIYSTANRRDGKIENEITDQREQTENTGISQKNISKGFKKTDKEAMKN